LFLLKRNDIAVVMRKERESKGRFNQRTINGSSHQICTERQS
jgi:hypothetical protein